MSKETRDRIVKAINDNLPSELFRRIHDNGPGWILLAVPDGQGLPTYYEIRVTEKQG